MNLNLNLKLTIKISNFQFSNLILNICNVLSATESIEVSLNGNVHDFSVDFYSIYKSNILNICKYLMTKNNVK